jgi:prevent-host-death family protein
LYDLHSDVNDKERKVGMTTLAQERPNTAELKRVKRIGAREARNNLADLIGQVHYGGQPVIIERSGKPMVALVPVAVLERYLAERHREFEILDRIRADAPDVSPEEVEQDVAEAIAAVRAEKRRLSAR